jgi:hypothetical protein
MGLVNVIGAAQSSIAWMKGDLSAETSTKLRRKSFLSNPNEFVTCRIRHGTCRERILMNTQAHAAL